MTTGDKAQIISSIATALTALFSYLAIRKTEELQFRPIVGILPAYYFNNNLTLTISNMSDSSDRLPKDFNITILNEKEKIRDGYLKSEESFDYKKNYR